MHVVREKQRSVHTGHTNRPTPRIRTARVGKEPRDELLIPARWSVVVVKWREDDCIARAAVSVPRAVVRDERTAFEPFWKPARRAERDAEGRRVRCEEHIGRNCSGSVFRILRLAAGQGASRVDVRSG